MERHAPRPDAPRPDAPRPDAPRPDAPRPDAPGPWHRRERREWRAGSGFGGTGTRDACRRNIGWLPNGVYSPLQHDDYDGTLIHGRAFALGRKACHDGTVRTDLFLHTESGPRNTQCPDRRGDQLCRWEHPKVNDYRSRGCIKMSPRDLRQLVRAYQQWFEPGKRHPLRRVQVRVRS